MANPELFVLLLNAVVTGFAYFYIYPKFCGSDGNKIAIYDLFVGSILAHCGHYFLGQRRYIRSYYFHHKLVLVHLSHIHRF